MRHGFFSIGMAKMVGDKGKVLSLDLQPKMLAVTEKRASQAGIANRISTHLCRPDDLGVMEKADFILTFWMAHEVKNKTRFFRQLHASLLPHGKLLIAEPKMHVAAKQFQETLEKAQSIGLKLHGQPPIRFSRSAVLKKSAVR
jgi:ubiquinone/menaquinone biosynthesis C-methylase UbiE